MTARPLPFVPGLLALAALLCSTGNAQAQSLRELYDAAVGYDAAYLSARAQAESAGYRAAQSDALRRPSVSLTAGGTYAYNDTPNALSTLNTTAKTLQAGLQAQQNLFNRSNDATIEQSARSVDLARSQLRAVEQDLIVRLSQAYFDVLAARDSLTTVQASKKAISEQLAAAKRSFEVGSATITDTREAQARFDLATAQELAADNDLRVKQIALDQLVGRSQVEPTPLARPVVLPALEEGSVDDWAQQALKASNAVQQARLALDIAKLETAKAKAANLPTAVLSAGLSRGRSQVDGDNRSSLGAVNPFNYSTPVTNASLGVSLSMPLYAGHALQNREKETLSLEEKARQDYTNSERTVQQATRQAYFGVQSLKAQVKALEAAESSTKLALEATQLGYKVGVRVNLDVLNAQTQLFSTQRDLAKARYDVLVNSLKLKQVAGTLAPADVERINALLGK